MITPLRSILLAAVALAAPAFAADAAKPNILFILAEDIGCHLSCYGEPLVQTPNLDRLAARGVRYTHAFTTAPVCSASRSAIMTGMYQTTIGAHQHRTWQWNKRPLPPGVRTITDYFRDAGYFTANLAAGPGKGKKAAAPGAPRLTGAAGTGKTDFNFLTDGPPFDGYDWNQRKPGQPFFAEISINESHKGPGWTFARSKDSPVGHVDAAKVKLPPYYPDHPVAREEYANYLDAIQLMDFHVGEVLARLEREGLADSTIIVFIGDNGQCLFRSKQFLYDGGLSIPLLIALPDRRRAGAVDDQLVSAIDLSAALLGFAGVKPNAVFQGRDFLAPGATPRTHVFAARDRMDESTDRMRAVRTADWKYIRNYFPAIPYMQRNAYKENQYPTWNLVKQLAREGKLTPEAALFAADRKPVEELYELAADPYEVKNLAADPRHAAKLRELRALVDQWVVESHDQGGLIEDPLDIYKGYNGRMPDEPAVKKGANKDP
ncbi:MAG: sulfatase [Verrucomicrobia bacterium]|nr:sulfatase [Verrucomicrobiota bacterium]